MFDVPEATEYRLACRNGLVRVLGINVERNDEPVVEHEVMRLLALDDRGKNGLPCCR
jgi:hypothetical protein